MPHSLKKSLTARDRRVQYICLAILALAVLARLSLVIPSVRLAGDAAERYDPVARNLAAGRGFSKAIEPPYIAETSDPPGYPVFVAAIYIIAGGSLRAVVFLQVVLDLATLFLINVICINWGLSRRGRWAAILFGALCPFLPLYSAQIYTEVLATFLLTLTLYLLARTVADKSLRWWMAVGVTSGAGLLVRPDLLPAIVLTCIVAAFVHRSSETLARPYRQRFGRALGRVCIAGAMCLAVLLPWTLRNYQLTGDVRPFGDIAAQSREAYPRWLSTWLDDPQLLHLYWWNPIEIKEFPALKIPDDERERAGRAIRQAQDQLSLNGQPSQEFDALAAQASAERPLRTFILVPLRRTLMTVLRVPSSVSDGFGKLLVYLYWLALIGCLMVGVTRGLRRRNFIILLPLTLIIGRLALPLASALGAEPRYLFEALPACFILAAYAFDPDARAALPE
jgi:4-amino-4-deoxy-L-arabinose transferase-like glycosyltransferase